MASGDVGIRLKLPIHGLEVLALPDEYRLPSEPDPLEQELRTLQLENARLKSRVPKLSLVFMGGDRTLRINSDFRDAERPSFEQVRVKWPRMTYVQYLQYVKRFEDWNDRGRRTHELAFALTNDGTAPASDIEIFLTFPNDVEVFSELDEDPPDPRRPARLDALSRSLAREEALLGTANELPELVHERAATIDDSGYKARFSVATLKHRFTEDRGPIFVVCRKRPYSYTIDVEIHAVELPDTTACQLHVVDDRRTS